MAIILGANTLDFDTTNILHERPAYRTFRGQISEDVSALWAAPLNHKPNKLNQAISATGRIETSDPAMPFIGTAFIVGPRLAVTARNIARAIIKNQHSGEVAKNSVSYRINFLAEHGSEDELSVNIVGVGLEHPYFDFALLELEAEVSKDRQVRLVAEEPKIPLRRSICVIGYPAFDPRNDMNLMQRIFEGFYGVKRIMPGYAVCPTSVAAGASGAVVPPRLMHDASTLGGCGGGPVVDLETGDILGMNYAGSALVGNYAVPSWELARDPYVRLAGPTFTDGGLPSWISLWKKKVKFSERSDEKRPPLRNIFSHDEIINLSKLLISAEFYRNEDLYTLTAGLPVDFRTQLPSGSKVPETLYLYLDYLNDCGLLFDFHNHTPFYIVLTTARGLRIGRPDIEAELTKYIEVVLRAEDRAKSGN